MKQKTLADNLSIHQEQELVERAKQGNIEARNALIMRSMPLLEVQAKKYIKKCSALDVDDLIGQGIFGLIKAIERFDSSLNFRFATYAEHWVKKYVITAVCQQGRNISLTPYEYSKLQKYNKRYNELEKELNRAPTEQEICNSLNVGITSVSPLLGVAKDTCSLDYLTEKFTEDQLADILGLEIEEVGYLIFDQERDQKIRDILNDGTLSETELQVIYLRFGFDDKKPKTLKEAAEICDFTHEGIRQIEARALEKLRNIAQVSQLAVYLDDESSSLVRLDDFRQKTKGKKYRNRKKH